MDGGHAGVPAPAARSFGTTVEVRDLFFNLPARKKFLKSPGAEASACADTVLRLALLRPDVAFTLVQGRQELLDCPAWPASGDTPGPLPLDAYLRRATEALGREAARGLVPLRAEGPAADTSAEPSAHPGARGYRLYGLVTPPARARGDRSHIYLAVNGRVVKDRTMTTALLEAFRHLLPPKRYPAAVLYLECPGPDVDVNVHPTKAEVRFRIPGLVFALFHHAVREAFSGQGWRPAPAAPAPTVPEDRTAPLPYAPADRSERFADFAPPASPPPPAAFDERPAAAAAPQAAEPADAAEPAASFDLWQGPRDVPAAGASQDPAASTAAEAPAAFGRAPASVPATSAFVSSAGIRPNVPGSVRSMREAPRGVPPAPVPASGPAPFRIVGQAAGMYILAEDETGLKIFDQHALHERILFEELLARARSGRSDRQGLLIPETFELTPAQAAAFASDEARAVLEELGFSAEPFGPRALAVSAVPACLRHAQAAAFVREILEALAAVADDRLPGRKLPGRETLREKAAYVCSCKGAIKAGERLTFEQMAALLNEYHARVGMRGYTCPHGRPLAVELTWDELERKVGR
ncbi:MAG: hypothetical protein KIS92_07500 [Planctomycetota bacterium]|nr:hypothetical protein [Planctomycetota bacterium]